MEGISINGRHIAVQGIKELDPTISIQEAALKTNKNGIDEVYFTQNGKNYIAYGDKMDLKGLQKGDIPSIDFAGQKANLVTFEDEANSVLNGLNKGALDGLKTTKDIVTSAISTTTKGVGLGGMLVMGGGAVGLTGLAIAKGGMTSLGSSPILNILGDVVTKGSLKVAMGVAIVAGIGLAVSVGTGAVVGAAESLSTEKNYGSIASVTKEGNYKITPLTPTPPAEKPPEKPTSEKSEGSSDKMTIGTTKKLSVLPPGVSIGVSRKKA